MGLFISCQKCIFSFSKVIDLNHYPLQEVPGCLMNPLIPLGSIDGADASNPISDRAFGCGQTLAPGLSRHHTGRPWRARPGFRVGFGRLELPWGAVGLGQTTTALCRTLFEPRSY